MWTSCCMLSVTGWKWLWPDAFHIIMAHHVASHRLTSWHYPTIYWNVLRPCTVYKKRENVIWSRDLILSETVKPKKKRDSVHCAFCVLPIRSRTDIWNVNPVQLTSPRSMPLSVNPIDFCIAVDCPTSGLLTWIFVFFWLKRVQRDFAHFSRMWLEWIHWKKSECHCTPIWETSCLTTTLLVTASSLSIESKEWRTWFEIF